MDIGVLPNSVCFSFTPSELAKELYFYPVWCGLYYCTARYFIRRESYGPLLLVFIRAGKMHFEYRGQAFDAERGDVVLLDCAEPHYYQAYDGLEFVYLNFDGSNCHAIARHVLEEAGPLIRGKNNVLIGNLLREMVAFHEQNGVESMFDCSMRIYRLLQLVSEREAASEREETAVEQTIRYVRANVGKQITLEELARRANLSTYYFSHVFKRATGFSPIEYVINTRLDQAKVLLLNTSLSVEEIADRVGYQSSGSLINLFVKKMNMSPREFRRCAQGNAKNM